MRRSSAMRLRWLEEDADRLLRDLIADRTRLPPGDEKAEVRNVANRVERALAQLRKANERAEAE